MSLHETDYNRQSNDLKIGAEKARLEAKQILVEEEAEGVMAEFSNPAELIRAAEEIRKAGYKRFEVYSPFPIHGMDDAMGLGQSPLGKIVFACGLTGLSLGLLMMWWTSAVDYPMNTSGKPFFSLPAFIPVLFEFTVLLSAFGAVFGMFALNRMPRFFHPAYYAESFSKRAGDNGFFACVFAWDEKFHPKETSDFFKALGSGKVELMHRPIEEEEIDEKLAEVSK
ncbi:MAG: DUF3341 domain-containing protein [Chloroherpetonaceae bacterium]|nr:DUF3341 domain-containing protein [Chloroherpetonaceae bacterium]